MFKKRSLKLYLSLLFITLISVFVILELIIKYNPGVMANFTDHTLRPLLGNSVVGFLEKNFFNLNDKIEQVTNKGGLNNVPQINSDGEAKLIPITPLLNSPRIAGEGVWHIRPLKQFPGQEAMLTTFIRSDPSRPYAYTTLVKMNMKYFKLGAVAGKVQPGGPLGNYGPGKVPEEIIQNHKLVAAFDGGFQYRDGEYGMIVDGKTYLPLKNNIGTIVGYKDGSIKIMDYQGQDFGQHVSFIRQNCPILVENGQVFALEEKNKKLWGRTFNSDIFTERSGLGIDANGNLIFAAGNNLSPESLATALKIGGALDAIQLDINPFWVRFSIFEHKEGGDYYSSSLQKNLPDGSKDYIKGYEKDFFYLYAKN